ncbi:hypothetical protein [Sphingobacterium detergens]
MKSQISTSDLEKLKAKLPHGSIKTISIKLGIDQSTVSKVLKGDFFNEDVISEAVKIAEEVKLKQNQWKNTLANL